MSVKRLSLTIISFLVLFALITNGTIHRTTAHINDSKLLLSVIQELENKNLSNKGITFSPINNKSGDIVFRHRGDEREEIDRALAESIYKVSETLVKKTCMAPYKSFFNFYQLYPNAHSRSSFLIEQNFKIEINKCIQSKESNFLQNKLKYRFRSTLDKNYYGRHIHNFVISLIILLILLSYLRSWEKLIRHSRK